MNVWLSLELFRLGTGPQDVPTLYQPATDGSSCWHTPNTGLHSEPASEPDPYEPMVAVGVIMACWKAGTRHVLQGPEKPRGMTASVVVQAAGLIGHFSSEMFPPATRAPISSIEQVLDLGGTMSEWVRHHFSRGKILGRWGWCPVQCM
mmetsp:Transcript_31236/g.56088  ORF Transcript_31236/g.56088 Transcript_31236/m.56088 type:complete len:148 (+) Transcript_31236:518-961(+)